MRVDVSLQVEGDKHSGPVVEIKNLLSSKNVETAVEYEFSRHIKMLSKGEIPEAETRKYNPSTGETSTIRKLE